MFYFVVVSFFFFQAEDGIRDVAVTGVQTCALPICGPDPTAYPRQSLAPTPERRLSGLRLRPDQPYSPRYSAPAILLPRFLEERLAHPHPRQPVARHKPPVVDRQAQRPSRSSEPVGRRPRPRYSTPRLRRRAGSRQARARALRREISGRLDLSAIDSAGAEHAP